MRSYLRLSVTEIGRGVVDEPAPHDDVGPLILDGFPCPQNTLAAETAAFSDPLRAIVVEVSGELNPHDSMVSKCGSCDLSVGGWGTIRGCTPSAFYVPGCLTVQSEEADRGAEQQRMASGVRVDGDGGGG